MTKPFDVDVSDREGPASRDASATPTLLLGTPRDALPLGRLRPVGDGRHDARR